MRTVTGLFSLPGNTCLRIGGFPFNKFFYRAFHKIMSVRVSVWLGGRVVRTLDLRSIGREFESWPLRYRVQPWASC